jgi:hypothetical protein
MTDVFVGAEGLDETAPQVQNQSPAPSDTNVLVTSNVFLEIVDDPGGAGVDLASVNIDLDGVAAVVAGVAQAGYPTTIIAITDGYSFDINPDVDLTFNDTIPVQVDAQDLNVTPNVMPTVNYSFDTEQGDLLAPVLENQTPAPGATEVVVDTTIVLDIIDPPSIPTFGVDLASINIQVNGEDAVINGAVNTGWSGAIVVEGNGYRVSLSRAADFDLFDDILVEVQADDLIVANSLSTSYSFRTTEGIIASPTLSASPGDEVVNLRWSVPDGVLIDTWQLRRSLEGYPETVTDGQLVLESTSLESYVDTDVVNKTCYFYTIFLIRRFVSGVPVYVPYEIDASAMARPDRVVAAVPSATEYIPQRGEMSPIVNALPGARVFADAGRELTYSVDIGSILRAPVTGVLSSDTIDRGVRVSVRRGDLIFNYSPVRLLAPAGQIEAGSLVARSVNASIVVTIDKVPGRYIRPTFAVLAREKRDG